MLSGLKSVSERDLVCCVVWQFKLWIINLVEIEVCQLTDRNDKWQIIRCCSTIVHFTFSLHESMQRWHVPFLCMGGKNTWVLYRYSIGPRFVHSYSAQGRIREALRRLDKCAEWISLEWFMDVFHCPEIACSGYQGAAMPKTRSDSKIWLIGPVWPWHGRIPALKETLAIFFCCHNEMRETLKYSAQVSFSQLIPFGQKIEFQHL